MVFSEKSTCTGSAVYKIHCLRQSMNLEFKTTLFTSYISLVQQLYSQVNVFNLWCNVSGNIEIELPL